MSRAESWSPAARPRETSDPATGTAPAAAALRALHRPGNPLVLPNAWDAASARAVEAAGFAAVATSSAAVAESLGYADGEAAPVGEMLDALARIAGAVTVPVTADLERGYGMAAAELVERLVAAGVVGCNLEDSEPRTGAMIDPAEQVRFLAGVRAAARAAGVDLVINARVDPFLHGTGGAGERLAEAVWRGRSYLEAGVDSVYPILATDPAVIRALVEQVGGPVNVLYRDGMPALAELASLGVARVSFGPGVYRAMQAKLSRMLAELRVHSVDHGVIW